MNAIASEIQRQYKKLVKEYEGMKEITEMLTDAIVSADIEDVVESQAQQIEKIEKYADKFSEKKTKKKKERERRNPDESDKKRH